MDLTRKIEAEWDKEAREGSKYTVPCLGLIRDDVEEYSRGTGKELPDFPVFPRSLLRGVEGKRVLCLASGGGQQSAVFGLLGAQVTVLDISEGQLNADKIAAAHYGYEVKLVKGDMRDLSDFAAGEFGLVYQPISICFVPDVREVYAQVYRVLKPGGTYAVSHCNPATYPVCFFGDRNGWDGVGYRIAERYMGGPIRITPEGEENMRAGEPTGEHRHLLYDIFGGLLELGFVIREVTEDPRHLGEEITGEPGSYDHSLSFIAEYFKIVCTKPE